MAAPQLVQGERIPGHEVAPPLQPSITPSPGMEDVIPEPLFLGELL